MNVSAYKRAAICAMTEFGLSNLTQPTTEQEQAVEDYFAATSANYGNKAAQRMMAAMRMSVRCVPPMSRNQFTKVLVWLREIADRSS